MREHARSHRGRTAVVCGAERYTFDEVDVRTDSVVAALVRSGVASGSRVVWLGQTCHRALELLFACAKLGAQFVPANWRGSASELAFMLEDSSPAVVVWQAEEIGDRVAQARAAAAIDAEWIQHDAPAHREWMGPGAPASASREHPAGARRHEAVPGDGAGDARARPVHEDQPVVRMYTAAFEGTPRPALLTHRNLVTTNLQLALSHQLSWEDVNLVSVPLFHILGLSTMLASYHAGATNVMIRRVEPDEMCRLVAAERVTRAVVIGPTIGRMVEAAERGGFDLSSLRTPPNLRGPDAQRWRELTSPTLPAQAGYGQTEAGGLVTFDALGPAGAGTHGRPGPVVVVRILGPDGVEVPDGETGEIAVRGPQVMAGYGAAGEGVRDGWRFTGDLGRREPDGTLSFIGPKTELIKTGAENVYPAEVEAVLRTHPAVKDACVFGISDPEWRQAVRAVVVLRDGETASPEDLIEFCKQHIASYKKPRSIVFAAELPRTAAGSVDRAEVKSRHGE